MVSKKFNMNRGLYSRGNDEWQKCLNCAQIVNNNVYDYGLYIERLFFNKSERRILGMWNKQLLGVPKCEFHWTFS